MSDLEELLLWQIRVKRLPEPQREFKAISGRKFRFDLAWPSLGPRNGTLVEVQGGTWTRGGHSTGAGIERDCEKLILATLAGWIVLPVTGDQVKSGIAVQWIEQALKMER